MAYRPSRPHAIHAALYATVLLALVLRSQHLTNGLAGDEGFSCGFILQDFGAIIKQTLALGEPHPVGYYFLLRVWMLLVGSSGPTTHWFSTSSGEFVSRWLSVGFGVVAVALLARLCRQLLGNRSGYRVALLAAGIMAVNTFTITQSREMRMYAMLMALSLASILLMCMALQRPRSITWFGYVVVTWVALQTHYYALFIVLAENVYVAVMLLARQIHGRRSLMSHWIAAQAVVAALTLPWLYVVREVLLTYHGFGTMPGLGEAIGFVLSVFGIGSSTSGQSQLYVLASAALLVVGMVKLLRGGKRQRHAALLLVLCFALPVMLTWWLAQSRPVWKDRYLIAAVGPFMALMGVAIAPQPLTRHTRQPSQVVSRGTWRIAQPAASLVLALALVVGMIPIIRNYVDKQWTHGSNVYRGMYDTFQQYSGGFGQQQVRWAVTYPDYAFTCYLNTPDYLVIPSTPNDQPSADRVAQELSASSVRRVLLMPVNDVYWNGPAVAVSALSKQFTKVAERYTGFWPMLIFSRVDGKDLTPVHIRFVNDVELQSASVYPDLDGRILEVHLLWQGDTGAIANGLKKFIHVIRVDANSAEHLFAQQDTPFGPDDVAGRVNSSGINLPDELIPGNYKVYVGLYRGDLPNLPRMTTATGADRVEIGHFTIGETQ